MEPGRSWTIADGVCTVPIGDHLLVGECKGGDIRLLNPTAALIWNAVQQGAGARLIARDLADAFGIGFGQASADVEHMLRAWEDAALLLSAALPSPAPADQTPAPPGLPCDAVAIHTGNYCLGAKYLKIRCLAAPDIDASGRAWIRRIVAMFAGFASADDGGIRDPVAAIDFCVGQAWSAVAFREHRWRGDSIVGGFVELCSVLLQASYGPFDWLCRLHAATLACGGAAIVLPAPAGNGKSTLAAYLAASGWTYLADDTTTLDPHFRALPFPTAVGLKAGSVPVLDHLYPGLRSLPEHEYADKVARYVALDPQAHAAVPLDVSVLVFPKYEPAAHPSPERLPAPEAAARLMAAGIGMSGNLTPAKLAWFAALVGRTPCWSLGYESLPEAEAQLRRIAHASCAA